MDGPATDRVNWRQVAETLREQQGEWVLVKENASTGVVQYLRGRQSIALHELGGHLEVRTTDNHVVEGRRKSKLWARWTPEKEK